MKSSTNPVKNSQNNPHLCPGHLVQDHWALGSFEGDLQVVDNVVVVQIKAVTQDIKLVLKQVHEMEL